MEVDMKRIVAFCLLSSVFIFFACNEKITSPTSFENLSKQGSKSSYELTQADIDGLILDRQQEKLARDVYTVLNQTWNMDFLEKIILAEEKHMDAAESQIIKFELTDPITDDAVGAFPEDSEFNQLFSDLTTRGLTSKLEALNVGKEIEEETIAFLKEQLSFTTAKSLVRVYTHLETASEKHLKSFVKQIIKETPTEELAF